MVSGWDFPKKTNPLNEHLPDVPGLLPFVAGYCGGCSETGEAGTTTSAASATGHEVRTLALQNLRRPEKKLVNSYGIFSQSGNGDITYHVWGIWVFIYVLQWFYKLFDGYVANFDQTCLDFNKQKMGNQISTDNSRESCEYWCIPKITLFFFEWMW